MFGINNKKMNKIKETPEENLEKIDYDIEFSEDDDEISLGNEPTEELEQIEELEPIEEPESIEEEKEYESPEALPMEMHPMIPFYNYIMEMESKIRQLEANIDNIINHLLENKDANDKE